MSDKPKMPERCLACERCAKRAYSDATTPGFFHAKCEYHRLMAAEARVRELEKQHAALAKEPS
jgi:hypothetical protein